jgi:ATP-binding cassette subfamily F protein 3
MSLIVGENVGKSFDEGYVLRRVRFRVGPGDRIGLVGPNGEGKTTLLRIVAGLDEPTAGTVQRKGGLRIGYLPQDPPAPGATTLWQSALEVFAELRRKEAALGELAGQLHDDPGGERLKRYGTIQAEFEAAGGYDYETRIRTVLSGLGFGPDEYDKPLAQLSGGERTRALLARLLLEEPDVLLLDEPTNHLDLEAVEWLERFLQGFRRAIVVVSHDRYFLDRVTDRTWEVSFGHLEVYRGGYTAHLKKRDERYRERLRKWQAQQDYVARTEEFIRRNLAGQRTKEAQGRRTRLERFLATEAIDKPRRHEHIHVRIVPKRRSGDLVLRAGELAVGYEPGRALLDAGDLEVRRGQRIAMVGANGTGKTTLLRTLLAQLAPLRGTVRRGASVDFGYLPQTHEHLPRDRTVLECLLAADAALTPERARTLLGGFLFRGEEVFKRIDEISGGQRSRVILARLAVASPNVLLLDEPTNHLDLPSREIVQDLLREFAGTVLFVSHDRYLVQALATHVWALEGGAVHPVRGGWDEYVRWRTAFRSGAAPAATPARRQRRRRRDERQAARQQQRHRQRLRRRLEVVEEAIHPLERRLEELMAESSRAGEAGDLDRVREVGEEYERAQGELNKLWDEYVELGERLEGPAGEAASAE